MMKLAGCAVADSQGRILLIHRQTPDLTQWEMPGGKVETGEDPAHAAIREIKEELGVDTEITQKLGIVHFDFRGSSCEYHYYEARIVDGEPAVQEAMHDQWAYTDIDVADHSFSHGVRGLRELLDGQA